VPVLFRNRRDLVDNGKNESILLQKTHTHIQNGNTFFTLTKNSANS
jgi:hypothetical protein